MIVPLSTILETIRPTQSELHPFGTSRWMVQVRDIHVPIFDAGYQLGISEEPKNFAEHVLLLMETEGRPPFALAVDDIIDQRQVVIKGLHDNYGMIPGISAATILGDGNIALIVDPDTLLKAPTPETDLPEQEAQYATSA
jgi:two-component system chemotaxis sensor kinase CheA